jgi:hypothetical protein
VGGNLVLDDELLTFIRGAFRSTWALELLLLMRGEAQRAFAADDLVLALRATPGLINGCLRQLQQAGLVASEESGAWRYAPASPALEQLSERLQAAYSERPVAVITAIVDQPSNRLRSFSDAFRFPRKDE